MTQVQAMTDQQLNQALTELMGYKVIKITNADVYRMVNPLGEKFGMTWPTEGMVWNDYAFPYCTDLVASLEVQAKAIDADPWAYIRNLAIIRYGDAVDRDEVEEWDSVDLEGVCELLLASPRERAEAAYITLQGAAE